MRLRKLMTAAAFFGVCYAWGDLPEGYEQVGGIASTKASKQYIYTDYTPRIYKGVDIGCFEWRMPKLECSGLLLLIGGQPGGGRLFAVR